MVSLPRLCWLHSPQSACSNGRQHAPAVVLYLPPSCITRSPNHRCALTVTPSPSATGWLHTPLFLICCLDKHSNTEHISPACRPRRFRILGPAAADTLRACCCFHHITTPHGPDPHRLSNHPCRVFAVSSTLSVTATISTSNPTLRLRHPARPIRLEKTLFWSHRHCTCILAPKNPA